MMNKVDAKDVKVAYAYATMDMFGWDGDICNTNADEVLKRETDTDLHRCNKCGKLYDSSDWNVGFCPICAKEALGDSHEWNSAKWSLWNGDSRSYLKNMTDEEVANKLNEEFAPEEEEPITKEYVSKVRELESYAKLTDPVCTLKEYAEREIKKYEK